MYTAADLSRYPFFEKRIKERGIDSMLDSLTGTVARPMIIEFIKDCIDSGTRCAIAIIDLDNFKAINDNYGHLVGDRVLQRVSSDIINYVGNDGVLGRFGGDEFLLINFKHLDYDDVHEYYEGMYNNDVAFRKVIKLDGCSPYISATMGSCTFPDNTDTYDGVFSIIDKTLYRGKYKGRNCYIIYVERLHKDLKIQELSKHSIMLTMKNFAYEFDRGADFPLKLWCVNQPFCTALHISECYYIDMKGDMYRFRNYEKVGVADDLDNYMITEIFHTDDFTDIKELSPNTYKTIIDLGIETILVSKIIYGKKCYGYVLCPGEYIRRLWQDEEQALAYFVGRLIGEYIDRHQDMNS
ncbi:diguanylate cyclase (GGDEF) domain-containing protein [Eubacterium ruminantium]|nr:diguanylate cyclase (GGDEF) domain-containing protein [Eubacterium ruminantium]